MKRPENPDKLHENVRDSAEGVEKPGDGGGEDTATPLIGNGAMTDPRYVTQR